MPAGFRGSFQIVKDSNEDIRPSMAFVDGGSSVSLFGPGAMPIGDIDGEPDVYEEVASLPTKISKAASQSERLPTRRRISVVPHRQTETYMSLARQVRTGVERD